MKVIRPSIFGIVRPPGREGPRPTPTCFIHVGTHKTGSTAIQHFLTSNAAKLRAAGLLIPASGRLAQTPEGCGHHCIAWDVLGANPAAPVDGSLEQLIEEIRVAALPVVCISSEEFSHLHALPNNMERLRRGLHGIGYRPVIVLYLRPQADYLEALYAEVALHAPIRDFWACYREVLKHGAVDYWNGNRFSTMFDYMRLIAPFERNFGQGNVVIRPFRRFASPQKLTRDFLRIVGGDSLLDRLDREQVVLQHVTGTSNSRNRFAAVIASIYRNGTQHTHGRNHAIQEEAAIVDGPFEVLRPHEVARLWWRFARTNLALLLKYRIWVGGVSGVRLVRLLTSIATWRSSRRRTQLLRALFDDQPS